MIIRGPRVGFCESAISGWVMLFGDPKLGSKWVSSYEAHLGTRVNQGTELPLYAGTSSVLRKVGEVAPNLMQATMHSTCRVKQACRITTIDYMEIFEIAERSYSLRLQIYH